MQKCLLSFFNILTNKILQNLTFVFMFLLIKTTIPPCAVSLLAKTLAINYNEAYARLRAGFRAPAFAMSFRGSTNSRQGEN